MTTSSEDNHVSKLEEAVEDVLKENNLQSVLYFTKIYKHWDVIVGESLAFKTIPAKLQNKALYVLVEDAAYSHHLKFFERNILDLIASPEICGEGAVKKVIFQVGEKSVIKNRRKTFKQIENSEDKIEETLHEEAVETSEKIGDKSLKKIFTRLMSKNLSRQKEKKDE